MPSRRLVKAILFGLAIGFLGLLAGFSQTVSKLDEDSGLGLLFKLRGQRKAPADVVVVSIDKESSDELGLPNNPDKWPRSIHARLAPLLAEKGAAAGWNEMQQMTVCRFGDNMREVAVTEGNKVAAQMTFGYAVNGFGVGDLVKVIERCETDPKISTRPS